MGSSEEAVSLFAALHLPRSDTDKGAAIMQVRLTVKLAEVVNGVDLSHCDEGDVIELSEREGRLLIVEKWAEPVTERGEITCVPVHQYDRAVAADNGFRASPPASFASSHIESGDGNAV